MSAIELKLYIKSGIFGLLVFASSYYYSQWIGTPNITNKAVADTAIVLIGLSMVISSLCYFWNFFDWSIAYRKHLGLIGFAFAVAHLLLSWAPFLRLFATETWTAGAMWPALHGTIALTIFAIMAFVSNTIIARLLGGQIWRAILRTGYVGIIFVWLHVVLLKSGRWIIWYQNGMTTPPAFSLLVTIFMTAVLMMRVALWYSQRRIKQNTNQNLKRLKR